MLIVRHPLSPPLPRPAVTARYRQPRWRARLAPRRDGKDRHGAHRPQLAPRPDPLRWQRPCPPPVRALAARTAAAPPPALRHGCRDPASAARL